MAERVIYHRFSKSTFASLILLLATGCSVSAPVHSITRIDGHVMRFEGVAVGYMDRTGTIDMKSANGVSCAGEFRYTGTRTGVGHLTCSNGERAKIQFNGLSAVSGYGYGTSSSGYPIAFTYGLDETERRHYLRIDRAFASSNKSPATAAKKDEEPSDGGGIGSGFSVGNSIFVTNAHVVAGCATVTLGHSQFGIFEGQVVAQDQTNDLAAVRVPKWPGNKVAWNPGNAVRPGVRVATYGYPFGGAIASTGSLSTGDVNALAGLGDDSRFLQISAPVQPGNSGGPLVNTRGELVGVVTSKLNAIKIADITGDIPQNVNFALKTATLRIFLASSGVTGLAEKPGREMDMPEIGELLAASTARISCGPSDKS